MPRGSQGRLVRFARELASGKKPREAALAAGYPAGSSVDSNARKRAGRDDVKRLVAEFKAPVAEEMQVTLKWALQEHLELYRNAKAFGTNTRCSRRSQRDYGIVRHSH
jgi:phage terminase small subunit